LDGTLASCAPDEPVVLGPDDLVELLVPVGLEIDRHPSSADSTSVWRT